jgi:hypothetical protein
MIVWLLTVVTVRGPPASLRKRALMILAWNLPSVHLAAM